MASVGRSLLLTPKKAPISSFLTKGGEETEDAEKVKHEVEKHRVEVELFPGDIGDSSVSTALVQRAVDRFGTVDILVKAGASIINTSSITAFVGNQQLLDYSATKGAITSFTKSLALSLADREIRVNSVAPGPIWTPLITSTFGDVENFGADTPLQRGGQPLELAEAYVFLAWDRAASYITGQTIHVNGGNYLSG